MTVTSVASNVAAPSRCPTDMVEVEGSYCAAAVEVCLDWRGPLGPSSLQCREFQAPTKCLGKREPRHFCIDRYEWPNLAGQIPVVAVDWNEARAACRSLGKRLCNDSEWTLACEGPELLPYPYGYVRSQEACNIDKPYRYPDFNAWAFPINLGKRWLEVARLDQREPSGARQACVSPYGVHDMSGNVDEWVVNESGRPFVSGLKGGYWGPVRARCRPMTTAHDPRFAFYQVGFRCCADPR
ncbi:MAG: SUMF1/EgtB/PvdO family nonheme iron enzyme [Myxococcales bacterium]